MKKIIITLVFAIGAFFSLPLYASDFSSNEFQKENMEENSLEEDKDFEKEPLVEEKERKIKKHTDVSAGKEHVKSKTAAEKSLNRDKKLFKKRIENELYLLKIK